MLVKEELFPDKSYCVEEMKRSDLSAAYDRRILAILSIRSSANLSAAL